MSFIQPCFIRKNTPKLRKKLEELGYFYTYYHYGNGIYCYNNIAQTFTYNNEIPKECIGISQNNEELFLALAALRDDTDINQWFINTNNYWYKCLDNKFSKETADWVSCTSADKWHKATVEEIIEHFK